MRSLLCIILFLFACNTLGAQSYSQETQKQIDAVENGLTGRVVIEGEPGYSIAERMKLYHVKGVSIAVVHNYKVVWAKGYGWANEEDSIPVTTNTLFEPGSISKSLNAIGILTLVQDGKLDLQTDVNRYLKTWKFPYDSISKGKKITLKQLLSHSAGLSVHGFGGYNIEANKPTISQILDGRPPANSRPVRSLFEPGLKFQYSGGGTTISQLIVTDITQQLYDQFMQQHVLKPMGMTSSFFTQPPPKDKWRLCATGYDDRGEPVEGRFHVYPEQAAAGLWTTPSDLCKYIIETQQAYKGKSSKVLNEEMTRLRLQPYNDQSSALGVFMEDHDGVFYFQHGAANDGFCGQYYGSLDGGDGIVVFANSDNPTILYEIINSVANVYQWKNFYTPVYRRTVHVADSILQKYAGIYRYDDKWANVIKKDGEYYFYTEDVYSKMYFTSNTEFFNQEFRADKQFLFDVSGTVIGYARKVDGVEYPAATKVTMPDTIQYDKENLNAIGWHLLENGQAPEAIKYLQRGLQLYPDDLLLSGNLAHAYLFTGRYENAIAIYKAHKNEHVEGDFVWEDMIRQDFSVFKKAGFFSAIEMNKVLQEMGIE